MKKIMKGMEIVPEKIENLFLIEDDYRKKRHTDVSGLSAVQMIRNASTIDLIVRTMEKVSDEYPHLRFEIGYDGLIKIDIKCNNQVIFSGDFYDVEACFQTSYHSFEKLIKERVHKDFE